MKIKNITNINKFFEVLEECNGKVELITSEGDILNLKSKLNQYIAFTHMFTEAKIDEIEIIAHDPQDMHKLLEYLIRG